MESATFKLFQLWKSEKNYASAMQACEALGLERMAATHWKNGRNAEAHIIEKMAREIGHPPEAWVLAAASEKTIKPIERTTLMKMAKKLGYAAALLLTLGSVCELNHSIQVYNSTSIPRLYIM